MKFLKMISGIIFILIIVITFTSTVDLKDKNKDVGIEKYGIQENEKSKLDYHIFVDESGSINIQIKCKENQLDYILENGKVILTIEDVKEINNISFIIQDRGKNLILHNQAGSSNILDISQKGSNNTAVIKQKSGNKY